MASMTACARTSPVAVGDESAVGGDFYAAEHDEIGCSAESVRIHAEPDPRKIVFEIFRVG